MNLEFKALIGNPKYQYDFLIQADSESQLLEIEEKFIVGLKENQNLQFRSISSWIPSPIRQEQSYRAYKALFPEETKLLQTLGVRSAGAQMPEYNLISLSKNLTYLPKSISDLWLGRVKQKYYSVVEISTDEKQLDAEIGNNIIRMSQADQVSNVLNELRKKLSWAGMVAVLLVASLLSYLLGFKRALYILSPPLVAATTALSISFYLLGSLNLFNVLAVYLIVALGLDYAVFYSFNSKSPDHTTNVGIHLSMFTSMLSFGLLSLSSTAAISSFGTTLGIGVLICFFLCPFSESETA